MGLNQVEASLSRKLELRVALCLPAMTGKAAIMHRNTSKKVLADKRNI
jgi:hypothetical protein